MSRVIEGKPQTGQNLTELSRTLEFQKKLRAVANMIHATSNIDEIVLELSQDICALFDADRLTLYVASEDHRSIVSKIKTGLSAFKDMRLPIDDRSVAGFVALTRKLVNVRDAYDEAELASHSPKITFLKEIDRRTGYRTRQMLAVPIVDNVGGDLIGVLQLMNTRDGQPFSTNAEEGATNLAETLAIALKQRSRPATLLRGKYHGLVADAVLSAEELELATRTARRKSLDLEDVLIDEFRVKPAAIGAALSQFFGVRYEAFRQDRIKPLDLLKNLKRDFVESSLWVPIEETQEGLVLLTTDPEKVRASMVVSNVFPRHKLVYRVCTQREFNATLDQYFGAKAGDSTSVGDLLSTMDGETDEEGGFVDDVSLAQDNELVRLVNKIIVDAYSQGASDIHIEPYPGKGKTEVRFRKDGTLQNYISVPAAYRNAIAARVKIMCDLDISEKRKPQDGKISFKKFGPLDIELRVATIPSAGGVEDIVIRVLAGGAPIPLEKLALSEANLATLKELVSKPYGLFFCCGPTGSGKTTTLHSILGYLNTPETKIWTAEDPVEITQRGLRQVQMNPKAGLDFATAMRAFLRADPDIIMVGEMRDKETTSIGIEASLTGHLVFATLHTNTAPESIVRLLDMGMDPFNFADALLGVLAQRLAKRLCPKCKTPHVATADEVKSLLDEYCVELRHTEEWKRDPAVAAEAIHRRWTGSFANEKGQFTLYSPVGCEACTGAGYKGRIGLHELLVGSEAVKKHVQEHAHVSDILATGLSEGMRTLKQDGIEKVLQGITDMHQVRMVCIK